ncbi:UbiA family prenyltransferase [Kitasatospora sp. DSM 101779]|uniref:UbiA family prenyltransferase n=1 Tax=Kitasatospora sp. DSM 101779 TaxID=2853165 RepID=UPI0021D985E7|nr:UbiA family prenyltransferase [Kitasatospora sp. DSM 101779]MCU7825612.1 UbiA family prenyltransferase [Kitasatospora sp. DSM 101779]
MSSGMDAAAAGRWIRRPALLLAACHPAPAAAVTAFAAGLAAAAGRGRGAVLLTAAATAAGQLSIGWSNDRIDSARDAAAGRADKPLARGALAPGTVGTAAAAALAAAVPLSLACGTGAGAAHLAGVAAGWAYNLRLKRTAASWLPYAVAFGALPAFATAAVPPWWVTAAAALLGCGAHFANVLPDIPADRAAGVLGLPQRLGRRPSAAVAAAATSAATAVLVLGPGHPVPPAEALALAVAVATALLAPVTPGRIPFLATIAVAGLDVALLLARGPAAG